MIALCFAILLGQIFNPNSTSTLPESEKAAIRDAADSYWRKVDGTNIWLLPLVSWDMNPAGQPRPLTQWTRIVGRASPYGNNLLIIQDAGRQPSTLLLTNLPSGKVRGNRVNAYALARGKVFVQSSRGTPLQVPLYDFGKIIDPPGSTSTFARTNSIQRGTVRGEFRPSKGPPP